jgi:O-succinylhomoserine sulfhydrylase
MSLLSSGDEIVASRSLFGTTVNLLKNVLGRFGLRTTFVDLTDINAWKAAIGSRTRLLFLETPSNPLAEIADIAALANLAHEHGSLLVVDNCFCTPALQRPLEWGADVVIHSATKYLDGQGRCLGGAVIAEENLIQEKMFPFLRSAGPSMSPFNAWVFLKGLETLVIRMRQHSMTALTIAKWLEQEKAVERVFYPGLESHQQFELASNQQSDSSGIVSFEVADRTRAWRIIDAVERFTITANLGDAKSIITHPASTTHGRLSQKERDQMGIREGLIRLSIGLEDADDLIEDLQQAFV